MRATGFIKESTPVHGVVVLAIDRLKKKNAISGAMYLEFADRLNQAATDDSVACIVITGSGDFFSSGADLTDESWVPDPSASMNEGPAAIFMRAIARFPKLLVCAMNGPAVGVAVTLLCHVDIAYAVPETTMWTPFFRMAIVPEFASSLLMPEIMGRSKASEMLFMGKKLTAAQAEVAGLISEVIPRERLMPEVLARLQHMLSKPSAFKSIPIFKRLICEMRGRPVEEVITTEFEMFDQRIRDGDMAEAVAKIVPKSKL